MIAVSNTTPLRYLIAIEEEHLLGLTFDTVLVPQSVRDVPARQGVPQPRGNSERSSAAGQWPSAEDQGVSCCLE